MAYIGKQPAIGNFVKLDAISVVNGQASYTMQNGGANFTEYSNVNQFLVSLNGILQSPTDSFTVSGSTITFASNLVTGDVIDFIIVLGNTLDVGVPSDNTVSLAKLTATGTKDATTFLRGDNTFAEAGGGGIFESQLLHVRDEKSSGTSGGASTSGDNTRVLNTVLTNEISGASLSSNQITLPSGTFYIEAHGQAYQSDDHQLFLYNTSDSSVEVFGTNSYGAGGVEAITHSFLHGRFTIASSKVFELRHYVDTSRATIGFGRTVVQGRNEVFAEVKIWKVS